MEDTLYGEKVLIDTEIERSELEYRPKVAYEPNKPFIMDHAVEVSMEAPQEEDEGAVYVPVEKPTQQYEAFVENGQLIQSLIMQIEDRIKDMKIEIPQAEISRIYESSPLFDQKLVNEGVIDFDIYKDTFNDPEDPANSLIQDVIHAYAEDVDGSLELEFYEDLKEMQLTLNEGFFLFKEAVLKNFLNEKTPASATKDESLTKALDEAVKKQKESFNETKDHYEKQEKNYYDSLRTEYGSAQFFKQSEEYLKKKRPYDIAIREEKTMKEMGLLVDGLLIGSEDCTHRIKNRLVLGSDIDTQEVMKVLENQATNSEQLKGLMKLTQLSLKLQLNQQIQEKKQYRDVLKNINNLSRKKRAHDEMLMAHELRNKMYLTMYDTLQNLESPSKAPGVESFLNQVAGGLSLVQEEYDSFLRDVYFMYMSEYEVRKEKIDKTLEKEHAREGYSLVLDYL